MAEDVYRSRAEPVAVGPNRHRMSRVDRLKRNREQHNRRRRRRVLGGFVFGLLVVFVVVVVVFGTKLLNVMLGTGGDYAGPGKRDVVIHISPGDSTTAVGETLYNNHVVATVRAFVDAAHGNAVIAAIQPGFYMVRTEIPAADAVARLADPKNRVGKLVIPEGRQLDDTTDMKTNVVTPGILTLISRARAWTWTARSTACRWPTCVRRRPRARPPRWRCRRGPSNLCSNSALIIAGSRA